MLFRALHRLGIPSDAAYGAGILSIFGSMIAWAMRNEKNVANAERLGIFIGLWAPTFMIIGNGLQQAEHEGMASQPVENAARGAENVADKARQRVEAIRN